MVKARVKKILAAKSGIKLNLDIGAGENPQPNFVTMDKRNLPHIDIVHDLEIFPYPLPDNCCHTIVASHIVEHIKPWLTIDFFNELWRISHMDAQLAISVPYGVSEGYLQDPTHCSPYVAGTFQYFDPRFPLWGIYRPKPWKIAKGFPVWQCTGTIEVLMTKMAERKDGKYENLYEEPKKK